MANKWRYQLLDQNEEKEEETVLIDNTNQLNNHSSANRNPFNSINHHHNLNNLNNQDKLDIDQKYELKLRNGSPHHHNQTKSTKDDSIELVEYTIKPNDSLLSIALSCNCSVEELKRVNKLINDQEFYGLRFIKIPVRKYGLLSEVLIHQLNQTNKSISLKEIKESLSNHQLDNLVQQHTNQLTNSTNNSSNNLLEPLINFNDDEQINTTINPTTSVDQLKPLSSSSKSSSTNSLIVNVGLKKTFDFDKSDGDLNKFLVYLDKDLERMRELTNKQPNPSIIEPLDSNDLFILNNNHESKDKALDCDGASCGLNWKSVFFIAIFICILLPLIYLAIYTEEQSMNHHLNHHLNHH